MTLLATANADAPVQVAQNIAFGIIAAQMIYSAIRVVTTRNVVHAALFLVLVLAGAAAQFILLAAEFVAVVQVIVYIGAIIVLFLFGVMLTRAPIRGETRHTHPNWYGGALVGLVLAALLGYTLLDTFGGDRLPNQLPIGRSGVISDAIFSQYLLPFEVISVLLTAALVGAIAIARRE